MDLKLRTRLILLVVHAALMAAVPAPAAQAATVRIAGPETVSLTRALEVLEDPAGESTLADVLGPLAVKFMPADSDRPVSGISRGAAWTRVHIDLSQDPRRSERRAQFNALHPDTASFFIVDEAGRVLRTYHGGLDIPGSNTYRNFSVNIGDLGADRFTLYARVRSHYISTLGQTLITASEQARQEIAAERLPGPLFGAMLLALLFCLLLWAQLREAAYGYGFAMVLCIIVTAQPYLNLDRLFWPQALQDGDITRLIYMSGTGLVNALGVMFSSYFLGIHRRRPRLHRTGQITAAILAGSTFLIAFVAPYTFSALLLATFSAAVAIIALMLKDAFHAERRAAIKFAVIAIPFVFCLLLANIASYNIFTDLPISLSIAMIGLTFLVTGITLGLADGFRQNLEIKVQERTAELSVANAALREAHEAKNRMLGVVAHDLRNPLSGIRAAAQLLIDIPLEDDKRETLFRTIRDGADVTLSMTEDLLDVAAIREGKVDVSPDAIDLPGLVEARAELLRMTARAKNIRLRLDLARIPPVWADPKRAAQVLDNLVSNAVKYSPREGEVSIEVRAINGRARLAVIDQGQGIPPGEIEGIFQPFERASPRPTGGERSVGLGLAIVKRLVEAQNGEIRVDSSPGRGSRFEMFLPFATLVPRAPA